MRVTTQIANALTTTRMRKPMAVSLPRWPRDARPTIGRVTDAPEIPVRIRPEIAALPAYRQGKQAAADAFKLSSNENPFDPLPGVVQAVQAAHGFNRYPDATAARLRRVNFNAR